MNESIFSKLKDKKTRKKSEKRLEEEKELRDKKKKDEEELKAKLQKKHEDLAQNMIVSIMSYISSNYKNCDFSLDKKYFLIENNYLSLNDTELSFKLKYEYNIVNPTFHIFMKLGINKYDYVISGGYYLSFKIFLNNIVIPWYNQNSQNVKSKNISSDDDWDYEYHPDDEFDEDEFHQIYDEWYGKTKTEQRSKPKSNSEFSPEELTKKKKTYDILLNTVKSHENNLKKINNWKLQNAGKSHNDEEITKNQITAIKRKIDNFKTKYKFEGYQLNHIQNFQLFEKNDF